MHNDKAQCSLVPGWKGDPTGGVLVQRGTVHS